MSFTQLLLVLLGLMFKLRGEDLFNIPKSALVSRINFEDFNKLPSLGDAWKGVAKSNSTTSMEDSVLNDMFTDPIGAILIEHNVHTDLAVVLNHMHYNLAAGENQVMSGPHPIQSEDDAELHVFIEQYKAQPQKLDVQNDELIPFKWRLNAKTENFESYEYLIGTINNADKYRQIAYSFEHNAELQQDIKFAILQSGMEKYLGIMIKFMTPTGKGIETNLVRNRQSNMTVFYGDDTKFDQNELYQQLTESSLIFTGWEFKKLENGEFCGESKLACEALLCMCGHSDW